MYLAAERARVYFKSCKVIERFEIHERGEEVFRAHNNTVVFKKDSVDALFKLFGDIFAELRATGAGVSRNGNLTAEYLCVGDNGSVGILRIKLNATSAGGCA